MKIYGAKASVFLKFDEKIDFLSRKLSEGLTIPDFYFDSYPDPPHEIFASCEALGFELWLNKSSKVDGFSYLLELATELSYNEAFQGDMYDLSPWLARFISKMCGIEVCILDSNTQTYLTLKNGDFQN